MHAKLNFKIFKNLEQVMDKNVPANQCSTNATVFTFMLGCAWIPVYNHRDYLGWGDSERFAHFSAKNLIVGGKISEQM